MTDQATTHRTTGNGEYADVNGVHLYYELHGTGRPMLLLHGGLGSGEMFGPLLPSFADGHQVVLPDLQGHGRTADVDRPLSVEAMADDMAALVRHLGHDQVDVVGYSLGGGVALQLALRHPDVVRRAVACSSHVRSDAVYPEMRAQQGQVGAEAAEALKGTPMYELYQRVAPRPEDFPRLLDKIGAALATPFDLTDEIRGLQVPTLVMCADADMAPPSHFVEVFGLLDGGKRDGGWMGEGRPAGGHALAVIPGTTHYDVFQSPLFAACALTFLDR
jgi:pimeloyl-ACP methyl ester carboxylesterase